MHSALTNRTLIVCLTALLAAIAGAAFMGGYEGYFFGALGVLIALLFLPRSGNYLAPQFCYAVPWLAILINSNLDISDIHHVVSFKTTTLIVVALCIYLLTSSLLKVRTEKAAVAADDEPVSRRKCLLLFGLFALLVAVNVAYSGYVPLLNIIAGSNADYLDFGIKSMYGFFNAFANVIGLLFFYGYLVNRRRLFLVLYFAVLLTFVFLVSRQNILSLLIESLVVYSLIRGKISMKKLVAVVVMAMIGFSVIGAVRSGDIKKAAQIKEQYLWIPAPFIWGFAYSSFNVLNIDNLVRTPGVPYYDNSSLDPLIPSVFRSEREGDPTSFLEALNFTVSSYLFPLYKDGGALYAFALVALFGWTTAWQYRKAVERRRVRDMMIYSVLYFCALMSFFTNFWFYLPVIFQIPIIIALTAGRRRARLPTPPPSPAAAV